jgi:phosphopantothenoylcysteine decarboxylase / phosphopantothenate---cysteine ligase
VLRLWPNYDCFIGAAAILDWDFLESKNVKIKKTSGAPKVSLNENPDILKAVSSEKLNTQIVIGFAAETDSPMENARVKLATKNCDAIFVNDVSQFNSGFEGDTNQGWWIDSNSSEKMELAQKSEIAAKILEKIDLLYLDKTKRSQNTKTLSGKRGSLPVHV